MTRITTLALTTGLMMAPAMTAFADAHSDMGDLIRTRDITGGEIYTMNQTPEGDAWMNLSVSSIDDNYTDIGEIEDIILNKDGQMVGIVAEIGGFLDIGDKHVMINLEDVSLQALDDGSYVVITRKTEEELEQMEGVDESVFN